jgi:hypothetical protein
VLIRRGARTIYESDPTDHTDDFFYHFYLCRKPFFNLVDLITPD